MRRWLSLYALSITSIVIVAFLVPLAVLIRDLSADRALNSAEREAQAIARFVATSPDDSTEQLASSLQGIAGVSIVLPDGTIIGATPPSDFDLQTAQTVAQTYRQPLEDGQAVVVPVLRSGNEIWAVIVPVSAAELAENVGTAWLVLGLLGVSMMVLALVVADRMGRAVAQPVNQLAAATHRLGEGDLGVRVTPSGPRELSEVGHAFNRLTERVASLMDQERESAADLAHRLRTPLTALRLDIEAAGRQIDVSKLQRDIDDLERVTSHIISEARRPLRDASDSRCDLIEVLSARAEFWGSLADEQARTWSLDASVAGWQRARRSDRLGGAGVDSSFAHRSDRPTTLAFVTLKNGHASYAFYDENTAGRMLSESDLPRVNDEVEAMFDALIGNVFAHTPAGTSYEMGVVDHRDGTAILTISDAGPGMASEAMLRRGASGGDSTGLGIDIVRSFANRLGGRAEWQVAPSGGTLVRMILPKAGSSIGQRFS